MVLDQLARQLGQPIVVENRPGAGGTIGAAVVAKATTDGYTILLDNVGHTIAPTLYHNLPYDAVNDFVPVAPLAMAPLVLSTAPKNGIKTISELISTAQANPNVLSFGSAGPGSPNHLAAERLLFAAKCKAIHVPFPRGGLGPELLSGRIDFAYTPLPSGVQLSESGATLLAVASRTRASILPNIPTTLEAGYADSDFNYYVAMFASAKTPTIVVD